MGETTYHADVEVTLDKDVTEADLATEPTPENALTDEQVAEIEAAEAAREVVPGE